jgi:hypothetical protein
MDNYEVFANRPINNADEPPQEHARIQDFETWLMNNGIADAVQSPTLDLQEEEERYQECQRYQETIHEKIFEELDKSEEVKTEERRKVLESWKGMQIELLCEDGVVEVDASRLAASCDTVFCLASSRHSFASGEKLGLSLKRFPKGTVMQFVDLSLCERTDVPTESVVGCCQIAHYLQNKHVLDKTVEILLNSIDTTNCLWISQLADQLDLPLLFERSLSHMMHTMGDMEKSDMWDDLTSELQERIVAIKSAIKSSLHSQSKLYFSSMDEYIAIFAERVQYYRERLEEAREQQNLHEPHHSSWKYAQDKIDRQAERLRTLESALKAQKSLFDTRCGGKLT